MSDLLPSANAGLDASASAATGPADSPGPGALPNTDAPADPFDVAGHNVTGLHRRDFLRLAGLGTGALITASCASVPSMTPVAGMTSKKRSASGGDVGHVVVIGAGIWGSWTAYHLRARGVKVTLIDQYGAGNSRSTSGDETRGVRSSYGDRATVKVWSPWARAAITRWTEFDREWAPVFKTRFFMKTGDVIMRTADEPFLKITRETWAANGVPFELIDGAECRKRWPMIKADDITIAITEPDAGVVRARASTQAVAAVGQKMGVNFVLGRARLGPVQNGKLDGVILDDGTVIRGDSYVFACGPWLPKLFPDLMKNRMRIPLGYVCYFGVPVGDTRFTYPNLPSFNFPGVTGWPMLPVDSRGFRVRGAIAPPAAPGAAGGAAAGGAAAGGAAGGAGAGAGGRGTGGAAGAGAAGAAGGSAAGAGAAGGGAGGAAGAGGGAAGRGGGGGGGGGNAGTPPDPLQNDPDTSNRWASQERIDGSRRFLAARFPLLANAPLLETRSCHYEQSVNRDFIIDHVPNLQNAWIAGVGQAEGFKFGPVVGEYVAQRVLGIDGDPALIKAFRMPTEEYDPPTPPAGRPPTPPPGRNEDEL